MESCCELLGGCEMFEEFEVVVKDADAVFAGSVVHDVSVWKVPELGRRMAMGSRWSGADKQPTTPRPVSARHTGLE